MDLGNYLKIKPFYRHVAVFTSGTALAQILTVIAAPLLTRLYTPEEFGILAIYISILTIFSVFASLQYEKSIPLPATDKDAVNCLVLSFCILMIMFVLSSVGLWCFSRQLSQLLQATQLKNYFWLWPFSLLGLKTYEILAYWAIRSKSFTRLALTKVKQSIIMVGMQIVEGVFKEGPLGLILGDAIGRVSSSGGLIYLSFKDFKGLCTTIRPRELWQTAIYFRRFPMFSTIAVFFRELAVQFPTIILAVTYNSQVVGWFLLVQRIGGIPLSLIGTTINNVYMAEASELIRKNSGNLRELYWQTLKGVLLVALPFLGLLTFLAPWAVSFILGKGWEQVGLYLRLMSTMYFFQFLAIPVSSTIYVLERQDLQLLRELVRVLLLAITLMILLLTELSSFKAIMAINIAGSLGFFCHGLFSWISIKQYLKKEG